MDATAQLNSALRGSYAIDREIGRGGMATVYLARDVKHDRQVAVKVLNPDLGAVLGPDRFLAEIKVTANLQHPNLLPLFDSGRADGLLFYVMPYVAGESLRAKIDREKQLPVDEAVRIAVAIAGALESAHERGVVHRDLKPENILFQGGQPVVTDFGIALAVSNAGGARITQTGISLGTPQYMSPEQATGDRVIDRRSDVYSLGAILYELLTGEPPHTGATAQAVIARVVTERPRDLRAIRANVPEHVAAAIERALEKLPADRFATAAEFSGALTTGTVTRRKQRASSSAWVSAAALTGTAVVAGLLGYGLHSQWSRPDEYRGELLGGTAIAMNPRVSPTGDVAFNAMVDGQTQVALLKPGTGRMLLLTSDRTRGIADEMSWSPDGTKIYYDRSSSGARSVMSVSALGGEERVVLENAASPQALPDGSLLARTLDESRRDRIVRFWPETGRIDTLPVIGGSGFLGSFFRAFRDGREAVFYGTSTGDTTSAAHLHVVDVTSKRVRRIAPGLAITPPFWRFPMAISADDAHVFFDRLSGDLHQVVAVPRDGGRGHRTVMSLTSGMMGMDVDRNGSLFLDQGSQPSEVIWFNPSTGRIDRLAVPASEGPALVLSDGRVLVSVHSGGWRVVEVRAGAEPKPFIDTPLETNFPMAQVGPDRVALILGSAPRRTIALASMETGRILLRLGNVDAETIDGIAATPDGKTIFYSTRRVIWAVSADGGTPRRIRDGDHVAVDPHGRFLIIKLNELSGIRLIRMSWPDGKEQEIPVRRGRFRPSLDEMSPNAIARDGRIVLRVGSEDSWYYPQGVLTPETGMMTVIGSAPEDMTSGGWAPDGRVVTKANRTLAELWRFRPMRSDTPGSRP